MTGCESEKKLACQRGFFMLYYLNAPSASAVSKHLWSSVLFGSCFSSIIMPLSPFSEASVADSSVYMRQEQFRI